jgi:hypothetical protein
MSWLQIKLRLLHERIQSLQDWVVIADSDELYDFDALGPGIQVPLSTRIDQHAIPYAVVKYNVYCRSDGKQSA